jgi:hypothetical protein
MGKSLKIGLVDLDTSHPEAWTPVLRDLGHEVAAVYDGGTIWQEGYAAAFARKLGIPAAFERLEEMVDAVDVAIVHACNWDLHLSRAEPFLRAGKAVLLDKPMIGNLCDANTLLDWAARGWRVAGGSSLRWTEEVCAFLAQGESERGRVHTVFAGCGVDDYNYGVHAYALLSSIVGPGVQRVRYLGRSTQKQIQVTWDDGRIGLLSIGAQEGYLPFHAAVVTTKLVRHIQADNSKLYRALLEATLPYLGGETDQPPLPMRTLLEPELTALAARQSWLNHGQEVALTDLRIDDPGYDGATFAAEYRRAKRKGQ